MSIEMMGVEVVKMLVVLAFQEARKAGMTLAELTALYESEKTKFRANKPDNIPDIKEE